MLLSLGFFFGRLAGWVRGIWGVAAFYMDFQGITYMTRRFTRQKGLMLCAAYAEDLYGVTDGLTRP